MMKKYYVYFDKNVNTLKIVDRKIDDETFIPLMDVETSSNEHSFHTCQMFCAGFMIGNQNKNLIINNKLEEFTQ
jgi:hypothetical protein